MLSDLNKEEFCLNMFVLIRIALPKDDVLVDFKNTTECSNHLIFNVLKSQT